MLKEVAAVLPFTDFLLNQTPPQTIYHNQRKHVTVVHTRHMVSPRVLVRCSPWDSQLLSVLPLLPILKFASFSSLMTPTLSVDLKLFLCVMLPSSIPCPNYIE